MSGGSFDYAYALMQSGETDKFLHFADRFIANLDQLADELRRGTVTKYTTGTGHVLIQGDDAVRGVMAVEAAAGAFRSAKAALVAIGDRMRDLSDIAHDIEWEESADYGKDQVVDGCLAWMKRKLATP